MWGPTRLRLVAFKPLTQLFGDTASVHNYGILSRIISTLSNRISALPVLGYIGDFGFIAPSSAGQVALQTFEKFRSILRLVTRAGKSRVGNTVAFLGLEGTYPSPMNDHQLSKALSSDKTERRSSDIALFIRNGDIAHSELEKAIGRMGFSQTQIFSKFARCMIQPLYKKLYPHRYANSINQEIRNNLRWRFSIIKTMPMRTVSLDKVRTADFFDLPRRIIRTRSFSGQNCGDFHRSKWSIRSERLRGFDFRKGRDY